MARPIALMFVSVLAFILLFAVRGWAEEKSEAPRFSPPDDPAAAPFMLEQRPLPGSLGGGGGVGMGKGRIGPGSAPVPDSIVAEYLDAGRYAELERLFRERLEVLDATAPGRDPRKRP